MAARGDAVANTRRKSMANSGEVRDIGFMAISLWFAAKKGVGET